MSMGATALFVFMAVADPSGNIPHPPAESRINGNGFGPISTTSAPAQPEQVRRVGLTAGAYLA